MDGKFAAKSIFLLSLIDFLMILLSSSNSSIKGTEILGSVFNDYAL